MPILYLGRKLDRDDRCAVQDQISLIKDHIDNIDDVLEGGGFIPLAALRQARNQLAGKLDELTTTLEVNVFLSNDPWGVS